MDVCVGPGNREEGRTDYAYEIYVGDFRNGVYDGIGKLNRMNGKFVYEGEFINHETRPEREKTSPTRRT